MTDKAQTDGSVIGIDATNLRLGGGVTHLVELLKNVDLKQHQVAQVIVWGCQETLAALPTVAWLNKISIGSVHTGYLRRVIWQRLFLSGAVLRAGCDVLFVPGGNYIGGFRPFVTMSRNMLPFQMKELSRYFFSLIWLRLLILRQVQSYSFRQASGMIFLTDYARNAVQGVTGGLTAQTAVIPHGLNSRFEQVPKPQISIKHYSAAKPFRLIYVSIVDLYKHQWCVVEAVALLRQEGYPVVLELAGPSYLPAMRKLQDALARAKGSSEWFQYVGNIPYETLSAHYAAADLGIFASSCENMPNILLETMASGLPVACSNKGPMPEVLGDAGVYFDPESPVEIAAAIRQYLDSTELRAAHALASYQHAKQYSWARCANETFGFLAAMAKKRNN